MLRTPPKENMVPFLLEQLNAVGTEAPSLEEKLQLVLLIRGHSKEAGSQLDRFFVEEVARLRLGLHEARQNQDKLKAVIGKLTAPPWYPAIFLAPATSGHGDAAMVALGNSRRVVTLADEIDPNSLLIGDEVLLGTELNVVMARSTYRPFQCGETAIFDRYTQDGRMVLKCRDEEIVLDVADSLRDVELKSGDQIRWDRSVWLAYEKIERSKGTDLFLEDTPTETFENIGGLDREIEALQRSILLHLQHADTVRKYRLRRKGSVLLVGPPGTGKTMTARALANWLAQLSGAGRAHFMNIKPAALHSMWYSQSEAHYREAFRIAREAGQNEQIPVVMFWDEVDAIGATRGHSLMRVEDRVLTAFMTELDGLESQGNILVVAATNRRDAIDPALLRPGRLGDLVLEIPRPNRKAARDILAKYLRADIPYAPYNDGEHGEAQSAAREEIIESATSRIFAPNSDSDLLALTFRDGKRRIVRARDLICGATVAKIVQAATEQACLREVETGQSGLRLQDMLSAINEEFECSARALTPGNCHRFLADLPQDVEVVRVDPVERKVSRAHRYLNVA